jgi:hypothetical protein
VVRCTWKKSKGAAHSDIYRNKIDSLSGAAHSDIYRNKIDSLSGAAHRNIVSNRLLILIA